MSTEEGLEKVEGYAVERMADYAVKGRKEADLYVDEAWRLSHAADNMYKRNNFEGATIVYNKALEAIDKASALVMISHPWHIKYSSEQMFCILQIYATCRNKLKKVSEKVDPSTI